MRRPTRPESETGFRELGIRDRIQDLGDGLLDQPIQHDGYPQRAGVLHLAIYIEKSVWHDPCGRA